MLLLLRTEEPTTELIRLLLCREAKSRGDPFVTSVLRYCMRNRSTLEYHISPSLDTFSYEHLSLLPSIRFWCQDYEEKLSEIIANLLISKYQNSSPNKRKRSMKNNSTQNTAPTADQVSSMSTECEPQKRCR